MTLEGKQREEVNQEVEEEVDQQVEVVVELLLYAIQSCGWIV